MGFSQRILIAIEKAEETCLKAVSYVGSANYAEREREARQWVRSAFENILAAERNEQRAAAKDRWREAVAKGETEDSLDDWLSLNTDQ